MTIPYVLRCRKVYPAGLLADQPCHSDAGLSSVYLCWHDHQSVWADSRKSPTFCQAFSPVKDHYFVTSLRCYPTILNPFSICSISAQLSDGSRHVSHQQLLVIFVKILSIFLSCLSTWGIEWIELKSFVEIPYPTSHFKLKDTATRFQLHRFRLQLQNIFLYLQI